MLLKIVYNNTKSVREALYTGCQKLFENNFFITELYSILMIRVDRY